MEKSRINKLDNSKGFKTPKAKTRAVNSLPLPSYTSESETETASDTEIGNSPRRGRPPGSRNGSSSQYIPRSTKSRPFPFPSNDLMSNTNETLLTTKRNTRSYISSSGSESDCLNISARKRMKRNSNSSSQIDSNESDLDSATVIGQVSTLNAQPEAGSSSSSNGRKRNKKTNGPGKENSNAPSTFEKEQADKHPTNNKKIAPKTRRPRAPKKQIVESTVQPAFLLRQNEKGVLIAIDNTEGNGRALLTAKTPKKGVVHTASISATNTWDPLQILEQSQPPISSETSVSEKETIIIVNNRLFKFDAEIPIAIQDLSTDTYVLRCGEILNKERLMTQNHELEFEQIFRIPMKISSFYVVYGLYFGHKLFTGNNGKKVVRKGFTETNISNSFYVFCRICSKLKSCTAGSLANFGRHLKDAHDVLDPGKMNLGVIHLNENGTVSYGHSERYAWNNARQVIGLDLLLQYMMDSNLPFANIQKFSLKRLLNFFDPKFMLPSQPTLHALLSKRVETEVLDSLKKTLKDVKSATLIVDAWSSRNMQGVLAISIVYLDGKFDWKQKTIAISRITGSHTAFNIGQKIKAAITRWNLQGKIRFVVSDGGSNMVKSLADLHEEAILQDTGLTAITEEVPNILERSLNVSLDESYNAPSVNNSPEIPAQDSLARPSPDISSSQDIDKEGLHSTITVGETLNAPGFKTSFCNTGDENISTLIHQNSDAVKTIDLGNLDEFLYTENLKPSKCCAHTLQRVLADGINRSAKAMRIHKQIKKIAAFGRKRQVVRDITKALLGRVVIRPGLTRWNSIIDSGWTLCEPAMFSIMRSLIDDAHEKSSAKLRESLPDALTDDFFMELKEFLLVSDPICLLTDELQANGITAHLVIPGIARTHEAINQMEDLKFMEDYRQVILRSLETKMAQFVNDENYIFSTVLCPEYKFDFFEIYFEEQPLNALKLPSLDYVKELCYTHLQTAEEMDTSFSRERSQPAVNPSIKCIYAQKIQERKNKKLQSVESTKSDFLRYIDDTSGGSVVEYWKRKKADFPVLFEKVKEILCKPATSGLVERLFSLIADINTSDRVNLNIRTIEEIIMYKEFINLPKTYREATQNVFNANEDQLVELVKKLSVESSDKKKQNQKRKNAPVETLHHLSC